MGKTNDDIAEISIHAPREGCDDLVQVEATITSAFQSTHPVRGATNRLGASNRNAVFQSTHPVRGATDRRQQDRHLERISIHAPREGCDRLEPLTCDHNTVFQSTHPVRGAT